ncbi:nuclear transport factor 2 family protein [Okeania sp. SIO3B5]|uniref:nuclear transport factor 2 family protein n=1 Tax=Okeania sp. SIO3B5 TaxID=2607811 RepID=UPI0025F816B3|nr:hypothetical protein [Okeania sp. SIO3B5]
MECIMDNPVAKFFAALKDKNLDSALSVVAEDVVFKAQGPNTVPIYGRFIGKKGVVEFLSILGELFTALFTRVDHKVSHLLWNSQPSFRLPPNTYHLLPNFLTVVYPFKNCCNTEAFEIYKLVAVDNYIFAHGYMQHRVKKTERIFKCEYALVCTTKNGLITSYKMFEDTAALSEAYSSDRFWDVSYFG